MAAEGEGVCARGLGDARGVVVRMHANGGEIVAKARVHFGAGMRLQRAATMERGSTGDRLRDVVLCRPSVSSQLNHPLAMDDGFGTLFPCLFYASVR